jgi:hypothetical protein
LVPKPVAEHRQRAEPRSSRIAKRRIATAARTTAKGLLDHWEQLVLLELDMGGEPRPKVPEQLERRVELEVGSVAADQDVVEQRLDEGQVAHVAVSSVGGKENFHGTDTVRAHRG